MTSNYHRKQKRLFVWTVIAVTTFIAAWTAGIYRHLFGFDPHWAGDNFFFNVVIVFPSTIAALVICYFTAGSTLLNWRRLPNKRISIITVFLSFLLIGYVSSYVLMMLRRH